MKPGMMWPCRACIGSAGNASKADAEFLFPQLLFGLLFDWQPGLQKGEVRQ